jgi:hypothetical protein
VNYIDENYSEKLKAQELGNSGALFNIYMDRQGWLFAVRITDSSVVVPLYWNIAWPAP